MNPYDHSDVAKAVYLVIVDSDDLDLTTQGGEGILACRIAEMLAKDFSLELQPGDE